LDGEGWNHVDWRGIVFFFFFEDPKATYLITERFEETKKLEVESLKAWKGRIFNMKKIIYYTRTNKNLHTSTSTTVLLRFLNNNSFFLIHSCLLYVKIWYVHFDVTHSLLQSVHNVQFKVSLL